MLMGNLTRDPDLRRTPKGTAVTDIGLAVNRYFNQDDGQRREETTFVDVTLWGRVAEVVCDYCSKGRPLYVEGRLTLDSWEDKATGQQRTRLKVIGENIQLLGSRENGGGGGGSGGYQGGQSSAPQQPQAYQPPPQQSAPPQQPQSYQPPPQQAAPPQQPQPAPPQQQAPPQQSSPPPQNNPGPAPEEEEDDIPF